MAKPPRRPITRKTDGPRDVVADRALVAHAPDSRQPGLFDEPLPKWIRPCLPTLVDKPPIGPRWVHEIKWDGYRVSAYVGDGNATIRTRNGYDWTARFPSIAGAAAKLKVRSAVIDGEAVILDEKGRGCSCPGKTAWKRRRAMMLTANRRQIEPISYSQLRR